MEGLNDRQQEAVACTEGPLLLLAGAGSGKTRVLTHRIAWLIAEKDVDPYQILAITFTNKAAQEMRQRVDRLVTNGAGSVWVSTFHALCVRILRRYIDLLEYGNHFTIYDSDDQKSVVKACLKRLNMDPKQYPEKMVLSEISRAKEQFVGPSEYDRRASGDYRRMQIARVYNAYQDQLKQSNALDFDDLLYKTVELFQFHPEVLEGYQERFRYIMVDEYQDTNHIQFLLIKQLASKYRNLCVVGDDDQSIYKFRGANIYNILNFEKEYPEARVIKLEQNYRSTGNILKAANGVISNNEGRKDKALWTDQGDGERVRYRCYDSEYDEARAVVAEIGALHDRENRPYQDFAILYRTNAQSRIFEEQLLMRNIPYRLIGGLNFYNRKEVKDLICYLKVIDNGLDDLAVRRIVNVPKRGIGTASVDKVQAYADTYGMSLLDAMFEAFNIPDLKRGAVKFEPFTNLIADLRQLLKDGAGLTELYDQILERTGYWQELENEGTDEAKGRMENLTELKNKIATYEESAETPELSELLEEIALIADVDQMDADEDRVLLMTLHSAKGLEFPCVYLGGMEDGLFPSRMAMYSEDEDAIEEERRLCYVGITRAKEQLNLSGARRRMVNGSSCYYPESRFVKEIPAEVLDRSTGGQAARTDTVVTPAKKAGLSEMLRKPYSYGTSATKPAFGKEFKVEKTEVDYKEGDRVRHIKFGEGTVTSLVAGGKDYEVTVEFDRVGVKKMFASFAKLKKV